MTQLVDDRLLVKLLGGGDPPRPSEAVWTTGYWYVRLCRAVLGSSGPSGVLSTSFADLPEAMHAPALRALLELPERIGLASLRTLAPLIGHLSRRHRLNALGIEVLAAAVHLQADVYLSAPAPRLEEALRAESRIVEIVAWRRGVRTRSADENF
ncbi:MAG: hypothetical protein OXG69_09385 [bacterium]|nr:hypothetical protein [bacterium]